MTGGARPGVRKNRSDERTVGVEGGGRKTESEFERGGRPLTWSRATGAVPARLGSARFRKPSPASASPEAVSTACP